MSTGFACEFGVRACGVLARGVAKLVGAVVISGAAGRAGATVGVAAAVGLGMAAAVVVAAGVGVAVGDGLGEKGATAGRRESGPDGAVD